jgi:Myb-like DNA-binding domain
MSEPSSAAALDPEEAAPEQEEEEEEDVEAVAAAAVAVSYAATLDGSNNNDQQQPQDAEADNGINANNKWSKNGYGAPVDKQTGKFSKEESELVKTAIEEYCAAKQISVSRLCSECDHKAELKGAWMEVAKRLPHRSVQSVYRHGIRQCHRFKRGAWSEAECGSLQDLVTRMGKKWSAIQAKLNRSADSCRDKYREMSDEFVKGRWKEEESSTLKHLIREHTNLGAIKNKLSRNSTNPNTFT